jgi:uncharacterized membrane protein YqaE (UPF0057 family)
MLKKFEQLIEVRKIIALMFAALFVYMAMNGKFSSDIVVNVIVMAVGFYFGKVDKEPDKL